MHSTLENISKRRNRRLGEVVLILIIALTFPSIANTDDLAINKPRFISAGETRELCEGQSIKLECVVEDLGEYVTLWKLNRTNVLFAGTLRINRNEHFSISSDGSLSINNAQSDLNGEYTCQISTNPPQQISYTIKVVEYSCQISTNPTQPIADITINAGISIQKTLNIFIQLIAIILIPLFFDAHI